MTTILAVLCMMIGAMTVLVVQQAKDTYRTLVSQVYGYRLFKLQSLQRTGVAIGYNKFGKVWVEIKRNGRTLRTITFIRGELV